MNEAYSLGPLEKAIMDIVWQRKKASVRDIHNTLKNKREIAYTTVMTIMTRLFDKGLLKRKKQGMAYVYLPDQSKEQIIHKSVKLVIDSFVNKFGREAVVAFTDELDKIQKKND